MSRIIPGRIVFSKLPLLDPQGNNPKKRRYVIISSQPEIEDDPCLWAVAITGEIKGDNDEFVLPWSKDGSGFSGLNKPSVAKACWQEWFDEDFDVDILPSFIKPTVIQKIRIRAEQCKKPAPDSCSLP